MVQMSPHRRKITPQVGIEGPVKALRLLDCGNDGIARQTVGKGESRPFHIACLISCFPQNPRRWSAAFHQYSTEASVRQEA